MLRLLVAGLCFALAMYGCVRGSLLPLRMVDLINRRSDQPEFVWPDRNKLFQILARYRALYPDGDLHRKLRIHMALLFGGMIGVVLSIR